MSSSAHEIINDIKQVNPMYHDFVFNETHTFLSNLIDNPDIAPKPEVRNADYLLFSAAQGFITGYGAALDDDYDTEAECDYDAAEFKLAVDLAGMSESWQEARCARFSRLLSKDGINNPSIYYSTYGFACGFMKGLADMEDGSAQKRAGTTPVNEDVVEICEMAINHSLEEDYAFIRWFAGDKGTKKKSKVKRACHEIENAILKATVRHVSSTCCGYSGYNQVDPQIAYNRASTYASAFFDGFKDGCTDDLIEAGDYELEDVPDGFIVPLGAFAHIDAHFGSDVESASLAKTVVMYAWEALNNPEEDDDDEMDYEEEPVEIPSFADAFWMIRGIGYVDGTAYAARRPKFHIAVSKKEEQRLEAIFEEEIDRLNAELNQLSAYIGDDGELTEDYKAYLDDLIESSVVEENGQRAMVINEEFYRKLGLF